MEDSGLDLRELRHAQYPEDVSELPAEWELLKPIRGELEAWKAALRTDVHKRLEEEAAGKVPPLVPGQIVKHKIFHICVDRPQEKERITTKLHRNFYEREYVRVTKLIKEVKLPVTVETLWRGKVLPGEVQTLEEGAGPAVPSPHAAVVGTCPLGHTGSGIPTGGSKAAAPPGENAGGVDSQGNGERVRRRSSRNLFKSMSNPFKDFVQPGAEPASAQQLQIPEEKKTKQRSGLRWCFAAPFTRDGAIPQAYKTQPNVEMLSQASNQSPTPSPMNGDRVSEDPDAGLSLQNSHKDRDDVSTARDPRGKAGASIEGHSNGNGRVMSPHEVAVRAALQAGAADESQHETFTQLEEEAVTTETIERFLEHRYYEREYVILVIYKGEKLLPKYYETLSRERFLLPGTEGAAASATS